MSTTPRRRAPKFKPHPAAAPARSKQRPTRSFSAAGWAAALVLAPVAAFLLTVYAPDAAHAVRSAERRYASPLLHRISARVAALPTAARPVARLLPSSSPGPTPAVTPIALPAGSASLPNPDAPITVQAFPAAGRGGVPFTMVIGGAPGSYRAPVREAVGDMVGRTRATAGLNGTFFANASLTGKDNLLIGPSLCANDPGHKLLASPYDKKPQLAGRPLVLLSTAGTDIVPYDKDSTRSAALLRAYQPGLTDAFLGGVWLVHGGIAADKDAVAAFHVGDAEDPRRRAFFALLPDGRPALGATTYVASSSQLGAALAAAGVKEAVLLDSGFSTSLVFQNKVLVTGHTAPGIPSRPVPQALLLFGRPTEQSVQLAESLTPSVARGFSGPAPSLAHRRAFHGYRRLRRTA